MNQTTPRWFETVDFPGGRIRHASKFLRPEFTVSVEEIRGYWPSWNAKQRLEFAGAFAARGEFHNEDQNILGFLMREGEHQIWKAIALSVVYYKNRDLALKFLLARIAERIGPLANYYQAVEKFGDPRAIEILKEALIVHYEQVRSRPRLQSWEDRFIYLDYLSCAAALFSLTRNQEYLVDIEEMQQHADPEVRDMARLIADSSKLS